MEQEKRMLISMISDMHKDAYGFRPRGFNFSSMTMEELERYSDDLQLDVIREIKHQEEMEKNNIKEFEKSILVIMEKGAGDRKTAIRWMAQAEGEVNDMGYLCYLFNIPYSYENELKKALRR